MSKWSGICGIYNDWEGDYEEDEEEEDGASMSIVEIKQALLVWQEQEWAGRQTRLIQSQERIAAITLQTFLALPSSCVSRWIDCVLFSLSVV